MIPKRSSIAVASLLAVAIAVLPTTAGAAAGDLDPNFGTGGKVVTDFGGSGEAYSVLLQPNGKIVVGGTATGSSRNHFALARYLPSGSLDPIFDGDGKVTTDFGAGAAVTALAFTPGGGIVAAGAATGGFAAARYRWDGSLDPTFGEGGTVSGLGGEEAWDVAIQSDGKIVLAGYTGAADASDFAVARLNPNGSPDPSFGGDGFVTTDFGPDSDMAFAVEIQPDGRVVVAGLTGPPHDFALARYNHDGTLDSSFDGDGKRTVDFGGGDVGVDLAIQSDGKLVVAGASSTGASEDFALARLNPDGSLDTQGLDPRMDAPFGIDGMVTTDFAGEEEAYAVAIEPGGKIVLAGHTAPPAAPHDWVFALARYNIDGSLDQSFGVGGKVTTEFTAGRDVAWGLAIQRDGKIVAAGQADANTDATDFALARYGVTPCCAVEGSPPGTSSGAGSTLRPRPPQPRPHR